MKTKRTIYQCDNCENEAESDFSPSGWIVIESGTLSSFTGQIQSTIWGIGRLRMFVKREESFTKIAEISEGRLDFCNRKCLEEWVESKWRSAIDKKEE